MNRKARRHLIVLLTACFSAAVFTISAFAQTDPLNGASSSSRDSSPSSYSEPESPKPESENQSDAKSEVSDGGGIGRESDPVVSKHENTGEAGLSSSRKPASYASVDTHKAEIEAAASRAQEAISDPDALSSEDWGSLLSDSSGDTDGLGVLSAPASSLPGKSGGSSWLFPVGIALILLSACGIGAFVYLQFFSGSHTGRHGPNSHGKKEAFDTMEFTDISSNSSDPHPAPRRASRKVPELQTHSGAPDLEKTEVFPRPVEAPERAFEKKSPPPPPAKAQAKRIDGGKSENFDWDKFFNDDF